MGFVLSKGLKRLGRFIFETLSYFNPNENTLGFSYQSYKTAKKCYHSCEVDRDVCPFCRV